MDCHDFIIEWIVSQNALLVASDIKKNYVIVTHICVPWEVDTREKQLNMI